MNTPRDQGDKRRGGVWYVTEAGQLVIEETEANREDTRAFLGELRAAGVLPIDEHEEHNKEAA